MSKVWQLTMMEAWYGQGAQQVGENYLVRTVFKPIAHQIEWEDARRIVASWNALAGAELEDLERDGVLADPRVATLVEAAKNAENWLTEFGADGPDTGLHMLVDDLRNALQALEGEDE